MDYRERDSEENVGERRTGKNDIKRVLGRDRREEKEELVKM